MTDTIGAAMGMKPDPRKWRKTDKLADNNTFIGVEIELENLGNFKGLEYDEMMKTGLWSIVDDGSLRNHGLEFVMQTANNKDPLRGGDITRALFRFKKVMRDYIKKGNEPPKCTHRTSIHVHMDVRDLSLSQLKKLILLYAIFEETFFNWSMPERLNNNYCRSLDHFPDITARMATILAIPDDESPMSRHHLMEALEGGNKYDAANYLSIRQRGSFEFRLLHGTYDTELMLKWINILQALKLAAKDGSIVIDSFPDDMSERGPENLIDQVFGPWADTLADYATDLDILRGIRRAQDILLHPRIVELHKAFSQHSQKEGTHLTAFKAKIEEA